MLYIIEYRIVSTVLEMISYYSNDFRNICFSMSYLCFIILH